jgi:uncharacterized glyoxalase superfamily protein PhnB
MSVKPIPDGYHTITPYLVVTDARALINFAQQALAAEQIGCLAAPDGSVMHAEIRIGDSRVMIGQTRGDRKPFPAMLYLYVTDADTLYRRAIAAGAISIMEPTTQFYGDRSGGVMDPFGNQWWFATHVEDVSNDELNRRAMARK